MTVTPGELKRQLSCHAARVKATTSAHSVADVIPFFGLFNIPFESEASIKPKRYIFSHNKEKSIRNSFRVLMFQLLLANKHHKWRDSKSGRVEV